MGSCATTAKKVEFSVKLSTVPHASTSSYTVKIIQPSLFYNLVIKDLNRENNNQSKENEYIDFRDKRDFAFSHLKSAMNLSFDKIKENNEELFKSLKVLLDFKNLILVGENLVSFDNDVTDSILTFIKMLENAKININRIYILDGSISEMLNKFSFIAQKNEVQAEGKYLPFILYSDNDKIPFSKSDIAVRSKSTTDVISVMHANTKKFSFETGNTIYVQDFSRFKQSYDESLYMDVLGINNVFITFNHINPEDLKLASPSKKTKDTSNGAKEKKLTIISEELTNVKEVQAIFKNLFLQKTPFLLIHDLKKSEATINALITFLETKIKISSVSLRNYIEERIPKLNVNPPTMKSPQLDKEKKKTKSPPKQTKVHEENQIKTRLEEINELMRGLKKATHNNSVTFQELSDLLNRILDNMIKNPQEEKYKSLNPSNSKLKQSLFKFEESKKLLEIAGFIKRENNGEVQYYNSLDVNSLKHIKVDFELGFKTAYGNS